MRADRDALQAAAARLADRLVLGPRPGKKSIAGIREDGAGVIWTLLCAREQVDSLKRLVAAQALDWVWTPVEGGRLEILEALDLGPVREQVFALADAPEGDVNLHCSAGLHRTGFMSALVLSLAGVAPEALQDRIAQMREVTAQEVGPDRLALAARRAKELL